MNVYSIIALALVSVAFIILLRQYKPEYAFFVSVIVSVLIVLLLLGEIRSTVEFAIALAETGGLNTSALSSLLKTVGIALMASFASDVCNDAGEKAIASKIEFAGKIAIVIISIPLIEEFLKTVTLLM